MQELRCNPSYDVLGLHRKEFDAENSLGSNIDDIRWNTTFVANYLYFLENSLIVNSLKFCFEGGGLCFSSPQKKFIKIGHRTWKIRSF